MDETRRLDTIQNPFEIFFSKGKILVKVMIWWINHLSSASNWIWYTFSRIVADVAPPVDEDLDYFES